MPNRGSIAMAEKILTTVSDVVIVSCLFSLQAFVALGGVETLLLRFA